MKPLFAIVALLILSSCAPRFGFDSEDPDLVPVRLHTDYVNDYRYLSPTQSLIPDNLPAGILKEARRPPYYFRYDPKDTYKHKQYITGRGE